MQRWYVMALLTFFALSASGENWPAWRGPRGNGVSKETSLPTHWSSTENVAWKIEVPGTGHSSPIVYGDRVYVTTATGPDRNTKWWVLCYNRANGDLIWQTEASQGQGERQHRKHGRASSTPATDGKHVWAYFGNGGAVCLNKEGIVVWRRDLREYTNPWGSAASVLLFGDHIFLNCDDDADPFLIALDKLTGETYWKADRQGQARSYSTPVAVPVPDSDRVEIVVNGQERVKAYDAKTGTELWTVEGAMRWVTPTPVVGDGLVYTSSGRAGPTFAIRPGGKGDVTETHVEWKVPTGSPYISSPVLWERFLFMVNGTGIATCIDAKTGKIYWKKRFANVNEGYSNSPVAADGLFYVMDEEGGCKVVRAAEELEEIAYNELGERCLTSPAISDGQIFLRTDKHLYCIGNRDSSDRTP